MVGYLRCCRGRARQRLREEGRDHHGELRRAEDLYAARREPRRTIAERRPRRNGQLKGYPLYDNGDEKTVKVKDHLLVTAAAFMNKKTGKPKYTIKETEEFLASVDLDALGKL